MPTAAFAHGGGGGGHGGGGGGFGGGGHGGGFGGGGGHFAVVALVVGAILAAVAAISLVAAAISLGLPGIALLGIVLPTIASQERTLRDTEIISGTREISFLEITLGYDYPYYGYDYPYYGDYDYNDGDYSDGQFSPAEVTPSEETIVAVQKELAKLGYYHGPIDGLIGPANAKAISWFQSVDKLSVTGRIDDPTLKALQIS